MKSYNGRKNKKRNMSIIKSLIERNSMLLDESSYNSNSVSDASGDTEEVNQAILLNRSPFSCTLKFNESIELPKIGWHFGLREKEELIESSRVTDSEKSDMSASSDFHQGL